MVRNLLLTFLAIIVFSNISCETNTTKREREDFMGYWTLNDTSDTSISPFWIFRENSVSNGWFGFESTGGYSDWEFNDDSIYLKNNNINELSLLYIFLSVDSLRLRYNLDQTECDYNFKRR